MIDKASQNPFGNWEPRAATPSKNTENLQAFYYKSLAKKTELQQIQLHNQCLQKMPFQHPNQSQGVQTLEDHNLLKEQQIVQKSIKIEYTVGSCLLHAVCIAFSIYSALMIPSEDYWGWGFIIFWSSLNALCIVFNFLHFRKKTQIFKKRSELIKAQILCEITTDILSIASIFELDLAWALAVKWVFDFVFISKLLLVFRMQAILDDVPVKQAESEATFEDYDLQY